MIGSYGPQAEPYKWQSPKQMWPKGYMARGSYSAKIHVRACHTRCERGEGERWMCRGHVLRFCGGIATWHCSDRRRRWERASRRGLQIRCVSAAALACAPAPPLPHPRVDARHARRCSPTSTDIKKKWPNE